MKLIDTDVVIDHFHRHEPAMAYFATTLATGEVLAISVITLTELTSGMRPDEEAKTQRLLELFLVTLNKRFMKNAS
jgi:predicted nucleic acid-binding protein